MVGDKRCAVMNDLEFYCDRFMLFVLLLLISQGAQADVVNAIKRVKPSVVGIGTLLRTRTPPAQLTGTGFIVSDGQHAITNYHVVSRKLNQQRNERYAIFVGKGQNANVSTATIVGVDKEHDLALLKFVGKKRPAVKLGSDTLVSEGRLCAFTGFPIGAALGLYPVTHRGIISAVTPIATQVGNSKQLTAALISRLRETFNVYQLDATAYPGNSGSPLYEADTGKVIGVVNSVFIKESKETVIQKPSGISYAIPVKYVRQLLADLNLQP